MRGRLLPCAMMLLVAGLSVGCESMSGPPVRDTRTENENKRLRTRIDDVEAEKTALIQERDDARRGLRKAQLDVAEWKAKREAALLRARAVAGRLPEESLRKFIEIAHAGGPFEVGPAGSLKAKSDVFFDSGKITLKRQGQDALKIIAPKLKEILTDKRVMLQVGGHTDNDPIRFSGWKDNLHLSMMRARAVVVFLGENGVPEEAMIAAGFGQWHPVAQNTTKEGRTQNRRVEMSLISVSPSPMVPKAGGAE